MNEMNKDNIGTIKILYYRDCPHYMQTTQDVKAILSEEGLTADIQSVDLARAPEVEQEMPFAGSPTILVNDKDLAPAGDEFNGPARGNCRLYDYKGEVYDYPPKELIREALTKERRQSMEQEGTTGRQREEEIVGDGAMPAVPEHDLDYHEAPSSSTSMPSEGSRTGMPQESAPGTMPAAPEHDLDYRREGEATEQPREDATHRPERRAEEMEEGPEEIDITVYEIDTIETEDDEE